MRRWFSVLLLCLLSTAFALAATPHATLTGAKWGRHRDRRVQRHHGHKAGKHPTPKRPHHHGA
ncbi:MAG TPA: hypothetical protein VIX37_16405 [Candidatus Sulfotelmatobacter sp.]